MLFALPKKAEPVTQNSSGGLLQHLAQKFPASNKIHDVLSLVELHSCVHWVSEGQWSLHDLLLGLLHVSGPADVYLSSYAFSEYPARLIADLKHRRIIDHLHCLIDSRIDKRSASALNLVRNCASSLKLVNTHAKVTVIENSKYSFCIIGSANYTTNKRYETGVIIWHPDVSAFHKQWIQHELLRTE